MQDTFALSILDDLSDMSLCELSKRPQDTFNVRQQLNCKLPHELLCQIAGFAYELQESQVLSFFNCFSRPKRDDSPMTISSTSKPLRLVALECTDLWTSISGSQHRQCVPHPNLVEEWMQRAGTYKPLHLHIAPPALECVHHGHVRCDPDGFTDEILDLFMDQIPRWGGIAFEFIDTMAEVYLERLDGTNAAKLPTQLRKLEFNTFECRPEMAQRVFSSIDIIGASVAELSWAGPKGFSPSTSSRTSLPNLQTLHIVATGLEEVLGCLRVLDAPNLEQIYIEFPATWNGPNWSNEAPRFIEGLRGMVKVPTGIALFQNSVRTAMEVGPLVKALGALGSVNALRITGGPREDLLLEEFESAFGAEPDVIGSRDGLAQSPFKPNILSSLHNPLSQMPTTTGVVDAFKNLIRHGKHHNHAQPKHEDEHQAQAHSLDVPRQSQPANHHHVQRTAPQTPTRKAAEIIVTQEREEKSKMVTYVGLENFSLLEKMGDGAFSNVYRGVELSTNQQIAVKVVRKFELNASQAGDKHLNPQFKKKPRALERANILKEVQIMRGIQHPSIVKLYSFSESPEHYFLVLELMGGGELFHQIVKLTYFSENLSRHVIMQVAHGIRHLHEDQGVVHRDIKPENLLFERIDVIPSKNPIKRPYDDEKEDEGEFIPGVGGGGIGRVKIADFGLSKIVWNEETMTPCGTVGYTAPEIVKDERYSKSVDMWALGCVLYTLLCGFPPFYDESITVLTEKVARGYYTFLSPWWNDISESAQDLIRHLLCVDPAQRYTIDEFLAHPWCNAEPAPPPPPTPLVYNDKFGAHGRAMDSPLLSVSRGNWEGRSPGVATLKEAFDITYAVHRMEEEGARRKKYGGGKRGFLSELNEDDEMEEAGDSSDTDVAGNQNQARRQRDAAHGISGYNSIMEGRAGPRDQGSRDWRAANNPAAARNIGGPATRTQAPARGRGGKGRQFELDLDGATLLERRQKRAAANYAGSHLRMEGLSMGDRPPGSPMQMV